ncbi:hypothetical protein RFI_36532 [Reticulomyxa filosa]|uniref:Uncharacterized protein n=1 Tax=Reticulomyxa filosa TaxID=46433 RepID=X6LH58_RETFI|nr:hypothetical protein RFI_36532 [Reticulomyxa filosa]|eukprot:ETO00909.1 hypothetical protein RFI_36532 [Reticulomyxa filosa]
MFEEFQFICGKEDSRQSTSRNSNAEIRDWKNMAYKGLTLKIGARHLSCDETDYTTFGNIIIQTTCQRVHSKLCDNAKSNGKHYPTNEESVSKIERKSYIDLAYFTMNERADAFETLDKDLCFKDGYRDI